MAATVNEIFLEDLWAREGSNTNWKYSIPYLDKGWTFLKLRISCYLCRVPGRETMRKKLSIWLLEQWLKSKLELLQETKMAWDMLQFLYKKKKTFFTVDLRHICTTIVILSRGINSGRWDEKGVKQSRPEKRENSNTFTILLHGATHKQGPHWFRLTLTIALLFVFHHYYYQLSWSINGCGRRQAL